MARLAVTLVVCAALAGCVPPPDLGPPVPAELRFDDCEHQLSFVGVPMGEAVARMPENFTPEPLDPGGQVAQLLSLATSCARVDNQSETMREILFGLLVVPSQNLTRDDVEFHFLITGLRTTSARSVETYLVWNVTPATRADVTIALDDPAALAASSLAASGGAEVRTTAVGQATRGAAGAVRAFVADGDRVVAAMDYSFTTYMQRLGSATVSDPNRVSAFALDNAAGQGVQEWGDDYGLVLTPIDV